MKISTVLREGNPTLCLEIDEKLFDLRRVAEHPAFQKIYPHPLPDWQSLTRNYLAWEFRDQFLFESENFINTQITAGEHGLLAEWTAPEEQLRFLPPVPDCPNMFGVVQNSPQFWRPKHQVILPFTAGYVRAPGSLIGHRETITIPPYCGNFRCATEFGVVIGTDAHRVPESKVMEHVFGYTCVNDMISNYWKGFTDQQHPEKTPEFYEYLVTSYYGRGTDNFGPVGPHVVTKDQVPDPYNLLLHTKINGEIKDRAYNNAMILSIDFVISQLSHFMTLPAGSIVNMGTMGTDGITLDADKPLSSTDSIEIEIEGVGTLRNYFNDLRFGERKR